VDLHSHSHFSDGTLSPADLVARAIDRGLTALSITDHDSLDALLPARAAAGRSLELVPGIELSSARAGMELHILGYFVDASHEPLRERLLGFREERIGRARAMVERLHQLGVVIDFEHVLVVAGPGVIGRPHIAQVLMKDGHAVGMDDAFKRFLGRDGAAFIARPAFSPDEAISLIHGAGGISVLAHPGGAVTDALIEQLASEGLRGLEVWHPQHGPATVRRLRALASRLNLVETGGSDFHGTGRSADLGDVPVPPGALTRLKEAAGVPG
jgi:predicted metal-dependent phosphoesterase TrpH